MCLAVPGSVDRVWDDRGTPMADVDFGGVRKEVCVVYLPDVRAGDHVLVHAGFAIAAVDDDAAAETLRLVDELTKAEDR